MEKEIIINKHDFCQNVINEFNKIKNTFGLESLEIEVDYWKTSVIITIKEKQYIKISFIPFIKNLYFLKNEKHVVCEFFPEFAGKYNTSNFGILLSQSILEKMHINDKVLIDCINQALLSVRKDFKIQKNQTYYLSSISIQINNIGPFNNSYCGGHVNIT